MREIGGRAERGHTEREKGAQVEQFEEHREQLGASGGGTRKPACVPSSLGVWDVDVQCISTRCQISNGRTSRHIVQERRTLAKWSRHKGVGVSNRILKG